MYVIGDLQIHSRFSRAVSKSMTLSAIADWARRKGIGVVATGDWTHPMWFREVERDLEEAGNGLLKLKTGLRPQTIDKPTAGSDSDIQFLLATEVSCIYSQGGKGRRIHILIWVPTIAAARKIGQEMTKRGCNLLSDGRPIIPLTAVDVAELALTAEPRALVIPAHAWTPWFSLYGSMSGFDSIGEAFGSFADHIYAVETGLSSDPSMNWRVTELDRREVISNSDAHSGPKLGREATVFRTELQEGLTYDGIYEAISARYLGKLATAKTKVAYTIEFHPEEGKYHYSGHRACNIRQDPEASRTKGMMCPVCGKPLTQGVMQRVEELAGRSEESLALETVPIPTDDAIGVTAPMIRSKAFADRPPYTMLVPLAEILSECLGVGVGTKRVEELYVTLTDRFSGEFAVLLNVPLTDIRDAAGDRVSSAVDKVRKGDIVVDPGYDGVFGVVKIWREGEEKPLIDASREQLGLF